MIRRRTTVAAIIVALGATTLTGCAFPGPAGPSPSSVVSVPPSASPTPVPTPSVALPASCRDLVSTEVYAATFGDIPLNDPAYGDQGETGVVTPTAPVEGAGAEAVIASGTRLKCVWASPAAATTSLTALVSVVDPAVASARLDELAGAGFTCTDVHGGRRCQQITTDPTDRTPVGKTTFRRDDIVISVDQTDFVTNDLLGSMVSKIWG